MLKQENICVKDMLSSCKQNAMRRANMNSMQGHLYFLSIEPAHKLTLTVVIVFSAAIRFGCKQ